MHTKLHKADSSSCFVQYQCQQRDSLSSIQKRNPKVHRLQSKGKHAPVLPHSWKWEGTVRQYVHPYVHGFAEEIKSGISCKYKEIAKRPVNHLLKHNRANSLLWGLLLVIDAKPLSITRKLKKKTISRCPLLFKRAGQTAVYNCFGK